MALAPANALLPRIAAGDTSAVEDCLDEFGPTVHALAKRYLTPVKGDVEGAVQEVFVELWRNAHRFDPAKGSESAFVMTMAHRRLIDRRRWHAARFSVGEPALEPAAGPAGTPPAAETRDEARAVAQALERLPADEQQVLKLSIYSGLSHERIAVSIGAPVGTVKTRIRRGLERLRRDVADLSAPSGRAVSVAARVPAAPREGGER